MGVRLPFPVTVVLLATVAAAVTDLWKFKVYNLLTLPLLVAGLVYSGVVEGASGLVKSVGGLLVGFVLTFPLYLAGGMGGGDVKLMAAVGAWLGAPFTFAFFLITALVGGVYALAVILITGRVRQVLGNLRALGSGLKAECRVEAEVSRPGRRGKVIPFAAMMAVALVGMVLWAWVGKPAGP